MVTDTTRISNALAFELSSQLYRAPRRIDGDVVKERYASYAAPIAQGLYMNAIARNNVRMFTDIDRTKWPLMHQQRRSQFTAFVWRNGANCNLPHAELLAANCGALDLRAIVLAHGDLSDSCALTTIQLSLVFGTTNRRDLPEAYAKNSFAVLHTGLHGQRTIKLFLSENADDAQFLDRALNPLQSKELSGWRIAKNSLDEATGFPGFTSVLVAIEPAAVLEYLKAVANELKLS